MPTERYRYDPSTGTTYTIYETGEAEYTGDVSTLLNGRYTLRGSTLRDTSTGQIAENLGRGDIFITRTIYDTGTSVVNVGSEIVASTLNASSPRLASYSVLGEVRVQSESGSLHTLNMEAASITGLGQRLLTYRDAEDVQRFQVVTEGDDQEAYLRATFGSTVRWATADEYTRSSIAGYIRSHGDRLLTEIKNAGGLRDASGTLQTEGSGLIRAIAQAVSGTLSYRKNVFINTAGAIRGMYG